MEDFAASTLMGSEPQLTGRAQHILRMVVASFIETAEPVSSAAIAKLHRDKLSSASVRNVMAALSEWGYLSQPHTSAGRVPTEKGFREYVKSVTAARAPAEEGERLRMRLCQANSLEDRIEVSSQFLCELTSNVGIAAAVPSTSQVLSRVELLALSERRVLMVLVTRDGMVRDRIVRLHETMDQGELDSIRNYVNRSFSGWELRRARRDLLRRIEVDRAAYDATLWRLSLLYDKGLLDDGAPEVHLEGTSNLVGVDLHLTRETMRELLKALEHKERILELLDQLLEEPGGALQVRVGLEEAHPAMRELALIGLSFPTSGGLMAKVAVLGPMRMHYDQVMSAVLQTGRALRNAQ